MGQRGAWTRSSARRWSHGKKGTGRIVFRAASGRVPRSSTLPGTVCGGGYPKTVLGVRIVSGTMGIEMRIFLLRIFIGIVIGITIVSIMIFLLILPLGCSEGSVRSDGDDSPMDDPNESTLEPSLTRTDGSPTPDILQEEWEGDTQGTPCVEQTYYYDYDGDGYGSDLYTVVDCAGGHNYVTDGGDCDDTDPEVYPEAEEVPCDGEDNDCDGEVDSSSGDDDLDMDGWTICSGDCDDADDHVNPDVTELCDGRDNDCDGSVDEGYDLDWDGYSTCLGSNGYSDCDDADSLIYPNATELCDGIDNDCDGETDEDFEQDGDGFRTCDGDCNDLDWLDYPGALERCDGEDNDCDGSEDEDFDEDGDTWTSCGGDCNDTSAEVNPSVDEVCDGVDNDCNGIVDNGC